VALPTRRVPRRALTASAVRVGNRTQSSYVKRLEEPWQTRAFLYCDEIGECRAASQFIARMMSRVTYFPARRLPDGKLERIESGPPVERLNRIQDPGGGRTQLQFQYGRLMWITGELMLFGYRLDEPDERWRCLWNEEIKVLEDGTAVRLDANKKETSDRGVAYRLWTPSPQHSEIADSPMKPITLIAEELLVLTKSVMSTALSRMTNGVVVMPLEGIPEDPQQPEGGDEDPENNVFLSGYIDHATNQTENPMSPEARVPYLYTPPYEYADRFTWVKTHDPATDYLEQGLRKECIERLALAFDMPPEALRGMTDANHWTAKQVMHDMWRSYGIVKAQQFADELAEVYLRPGLEEDGYAEWPEVVIGMDDSQVVISPDRTEDADKALDRIAIGFPGYRKMKGIPEDMAPTDEEKEFLAALKIRQEVELEDGELVIPQRGPIPQNGNGNGNAADGPPDPGARLVSRQESRTASAEVKGAAKMALRRCRETAGARLRRYQQTCDECEALTDGAPNSLVASLLGQERVEGLGVDAFNLTAGTAVGFRGYLEDEGLKPAHATALQQMLEVYAARTLYDDAQPELPSGFVAQVEKAREVSVAVAQ